MSQLNEQTMNNINTFKIPDKKKLNPKISIRLRAFDIHGILI